MHRLQPAANAIRFIAVDAIVKATEGHQGVPLGMAEIATALYFDHLKHDPSDPLWFDRDRVVLSNGHGSMLLYALLYLSGYEGMTIEQIKTFRELGSHCAGHPEYDPKLGIELTTGQLGQGIANAMGMAIAEAFLRSRFGSDLVDHYTYAFVGDGCLQEGVGQEMISLAGHLRLGRLVLLMDDNAITDDGSTSLSISEDVGKRFEVANWHVQRVDGHDIDSVSAAIGSAKADDRPSVILAKTTIAKGLARLQGQRGGHSARLYPEDADQMRREFGWDGAPFEVPEEILKSWRASSTSGRTANHEWQRRVARMPAQERAEYEGFISGELSNQTLAALAAVKDRLHGEPARGGINLSAEVNSMLSTVLPNRLVACADLEAPTDHKRQQTAFCADDQSGTYIHCGVREHLMGSIANGMAAHGGVLPVSVTYLAFADYMRPAIRMAALMGLPVKFVFSHDSIGIGKNGPTHQPVEILAGLRATPNLLVMRPADAVEVVECWEVALKHDAGPVALIFARQALPNVRQACAEPNMSARGAYVLVPESQSPREVTLLATGSEVRIAVEAREILESQGIATAVVSMPCWELFEQQDPDYQRHVLGQGVVRVAVEAAVEQGWQRYTGATGGFVGMKGYGLSGPAQALYEHFGITAKAIVEKAIELLAQTACNAS